jgi:hypothetical protein
LGGQPWTFPKIVLKPCSIAVSLKWASSSPRQRGGLATVFSVTAAHWLLDAITSRTLHFGHQGVDRLACFDGPGAEPMKEMMRESAFRLLIQSAGNAPGFYGKPYIRELEVHSPFRFSFVRQQRGSWTAQSAPLMALVEAYSRGDQV